MAKNNIAYLMDARIMNKLKQFHSYTSNSMVTSNQTFDHGSLREYSSVWILRNRLKLIIKNSIRQIA